METNQIKTLCKEKEQELLDKYFGNLVHEAAIERPKTTGRTKVKYEVTRKVSW